MTKQQTLLLSPTENEVRKTLAAHYPDYIVRNSALCEPNGADIITRSSKGLVGYQRKTLSDLKASLIDGRLYKELAQLRTSSIIAYPFLIVEHDSRQVTTDGSFLDVTFPLRDYQSLITKIQVVGIKYLHSLNHRGTIDAIVNSSTYLSKTSSTELRRPTPPKNAWGEKGNKEYLSYILQSFPGIGPKVADAIVKHFGGLPLAWLLEVDELMEVPGVGRQTADKLYNFFNSP